MAFLAVVLLMRKIVEDEYLLQKALSWCLGASEQHFGLFAVHKGSQNVNLLYSKCQKGPKPDMKNLDSFWCRP
jgi:hypothetical protein